MDKHLKECYSLLGTLRESLGRATDEHDRIWIRSLIRNVEATINFREATLMASDKPSEQANEFAAKKMADDFISKLRLGTKNA